MAAIPLLSVLGAVTTVAITDVVQKNKNRKIALPVVTLTGFTNTTATIEVARDTVLFDYTYSVNGDEPVALSVANGFIVSDLAANTLHSVVVTATKKNDTNSASTTLTFTTLAFPHHAAPTITGVTHNAATLTLSRVTGFTYQYRLNGGTLTTIPTNATSLSGLAANTSYTVLVITTRTANPAATPPILTATSSTSVTFKTLPFAPPSCTIDNITNISARLNVTLDTANYTYEYTRNAGVSFVVFTTTPTTPISGLSPSTSYTLVVTAIRKSDLATSSTVLQFTTLSS